MTEDVTPNRRGRGGRPRSANPKTDQVMVRLAPDERAALDERAGPGGVAEYLRACGLGRRPRVARTVPAVNAAAWTALSGAVANLNQLARHANQGIVVSQGLASALEEVRLQLIAVRAALLGRDEDPSPTERDEPS